MFPLAMNSWDFGFSDSRRQSSPHPYGIHGRHGHPLDADFEHGNDCNDATHRQGRLGLSWTGTHHMYAHITFARIMYLW